jgi:hypothetical protein
MTQPTVLNIRARARTHTHTHTHTRRPTRTECICDFVYHDVKIKRTEVKHDCDVRVTFRVRKRIILTSYRLIETFMELLEICRITTKVHALIQRNVAELSTAIVF